MNGNIDYRALAQRNGWDYSYGQEDNRPYFMKDGKYAVPDENTSVEDKRLLANAISEGSREMARLILTCWNNGIKIVGPCSGIRSEHKKQPTCLHFGFIGNSELVSKIYETIANTFPSYSHLYRELSSEESRYDLNYYLNGKELTKDEADTIFEVINLKLPIILENMESKIRR